MEEQEKWVFYAYIDWECVKNNRFNIDTRDFHTGYLWEDKPHPDIKTLEKYPQKFFYTTTQLVALLDRLYTESGGSGEWRMLELDCNDNRVKNWKLKYLRIYRINGLYLVCNNDHHAIPKDILACKVNKRYLHHH